MILIMYRILYLTEGSHTHAFVSSIVSVPQQVCPHFQPSFSVFDPSGIINIEDRSSLKQDCQKDLCTILYFYKYHMTTMVNCLLQLETADP